MFASIQTALAVCFNAADQHKFLVLGVFPDDTPVPVRVLEMAWHMKPEKCLHLLQALEQAALLKYDRNDGAVLLHDLQARAWTTVVDRLSAPAPFWDCCATARTRSPVV